MVGLRKTLCVSLAVAAALAGGRPAAAQEETSMALPALTIGFSSTYIADAMGFWTKRGLTVKLHDIVGIGSMNAMLAGSVDFSNSSGPTVIRANIRGQKVQGIGSTLDGLPFEIVMRKDIMDASGLTETSPIDKKAQLLKGKKISLTSVNTIPHAYLRYFARKGGIDPERDMTVVAMPPEAGLAALKNATTDGYVQGVPWPIIAVNQGTGKRLATALRGDAPEMLPFSFNIVVTRAGLCDQKPTVCQKLMDGYLEGMNFMLDKPKESLEILAKKMPKMEPAVLKEGFELTVKWTTRTTKILEDGLKNSQELMLVGGMLKPEERLASFADLYTNKFTK
jgi:ABC-type nitrate/sulfonate/bicarbonate transport system substrate-binding protein